MPSHALSRNQARESYLMMLLRQHIADAGLPEPVSEHRGIPGRRFRFDLAWPDLMVACEIEGGIWIEGRHTRGSGYERDVEKYNLAVLHGWTVIRATPAMVESGETANMLIWALRGRAA